MRRTKFTILILLTLMVSADVAHAQKQVAKQPAQFVIDPGRPFVYLKFERIGPAQSGDEPIPRMWLRLVNNCDVSILVRAFGVSDGHSFDSARIGVTREHPDDEIGLMDYVLPNPQPHATNVFMGADGDVHKSPPPVADQGDMPRGYDFDVSASVSIASGQSVLFSIPVNHVSTKWHFEIPFEFDLQREKGPRDPIVGGQPRLVLEYGLWDLPPERQTEVEAIIERPRSQQ
jgi:hypothetical protein